MHTCGPSTGVAEVGRAEVQATQLLWKFKVSVGGMRHTHTHRLGEKETGREGEKEKEKGRDLYSLCENPSMVVHELANT